MKGGKGREKCYQITISKINSNEKGHGFVGKTEKCC